VTNSLRVASGRGCNAKPLRHFAVSHHPHETTITRSRKTVRHMRENIGWNQSSDCENQVKSIGTMFIFCFQIYFRNVSCYCNKYMSSQDITTFYISGWMEQYY
jgi:hypothetical protein